MKITNLGSIKDKKRYKFLELIGNGSYGYVESYYDKKLKKKVAVKTLKYTNNLLILKLALRELKILTHL